MTSTFADRPIGRFLEDVASSRITPSGGATAAVGGATGAALCEMVCLHTTDADGDILPTLADAAADLATHRARLLELADEDSAAVDALETSFADGTADETAAKRATEVPVAIAERCRSVLECAAVTVANGNERARADAVTGALFARSALESVVFIVDANANMLSDPATVSTIERRIEAAEREGTAAADRIADAIDGGF